MASGEVAAAAAAVPPGPGPVASVPVGQARQAGEAGRAGRQAGRRIWQQDIAGWLRIQATGSGWPQVQITA